MGITAADETDRQAGNLSGPQSKPMGSVDVTRRRSSKHLAYITVGKDQVRVWFKDGALCFRPKHKRKIEKLSLGAAYDVACGQLQFFYGKDH
jgi:hypothetical protein